MIAQAIASIVVTGLMARELGGGRLAQMTAALAVALSTLPLFEGTEFQYTTFDYLWWVLIAYFVIRLLKTENPRWWLAIGATHGHWISDQIHDGVLRLRNLGGMLLTRARRYLLERMVLGRNGSGAAIFLPNIDLAGAPRLHLAAFPAAHSQARRRPGPRQRILPGSILDLHESRLPRRCGSRDCWAICGTGAIACWRGCI